MQVDPPDDNNLSGLVTETTSRIAADMLTSQSGLEALNRVAEAARILARAQYAALGVARPNGDGLLAFITAGISPEDEKAIGPRPTGKGILGLLLHCQEPLRIDRLSDHPDSVGFPPHHPAMESFLGVPIRWEERTLGILYLTNKIGGTFTEQDAIAVQALGECASVAIHNHLLLLRQRALVRGLIAAQEEERRAIAYDLHDGLTQYVMAAHSYLDTARQAQEDGHQEKSAEMMEQGMRYLADAVLESRRLVSGLRSLVLDDMGLAGAVYQLCNEEKARAGWEYAELIHNIEGR
jgi:signal transduction histidine kinase